MPKAKKPREDKYDTKLAINRTFDAGIKASTIPMHKQEEKPKDKKKNKQRITTRLVRLRP